MNYKKPIATLIASTPLNVAEVAARVCYDSFELSEHEQIREFPTTKCFKGYIKTSSVMDKVYNAYFHESIGEHVHLSYYIEQVPRNVVIEINRHRVGVETSQQSSRYTLEKLVDAWIEDKENWGAGIITNNFYDVVKANVIHEDSNNIMEVHNYLSNMLSHYDAEQLLIKGLTGSKKKVQNDRIKPILPESWMLKGVWTFNLRSLKHMVKLRDSGSAYWGAREFIQAIIKATPEEYLPYIK